MTSHELEYSYDGWLVFNELLSTEVHGGESHDIPDITESFSTYTEGSPKDAQSGFTRLSIEQDLRDMGELGPQLRQFSERLRAFRYIDEEWVEQWGYDENGNDQLYYLDRHDQVDLFWDTENEVMMLKGNKQLLDRKRAKLRGALSGDLKLDDISFDYDFFLWLLYKEYEDEKLDAGSDLRIRKMTRGETVASAENDESRVRVEGKEDILKSVVMLVPVLEGERIRGLQGNFILDTKQIEAKIKFGGRVHVLVTDNPMSSWEDARQMGLSVMFLSELVKLYQLWEKLDSEDKYPPPSFFDDLRENANDEGWKLRFDPQEVKSEYNRKREGAGEGADDSQPEVEVGE
ncbi:hypothetical protein [Halorubrum sp. F4]|uniref:hypothetical protein n=1 Tax=Halorubrum sp. F4 TaxID=2989715 RepID=UPI00247FD705|nr:hypothetical protein [Halorubrum sp. F4]